MKRYGIIYKITYLIDNKSYIGQTIQTLSKRISQHIRDNRSGRYLHRVLNKNTVNDFKIEELLTCFDQASLNYYETFFIEQFDTLSPNGYNLCKGGNQRGVISDQTRKLKSSLHKGKAYRKNCKWSEQSKLNFSRKQGGKSIIAENLVTGEIKIYNYIQEACRDGFENSCIYYVLKGQRKSHKGFKFYYANQNGSKETKNS